MNNIPLIAVAVASTGIFLLLLFYLTRFFCHHSKNQQQQPPIQRATSLQNGILKLHQQQNTPNNKRRTNYYVLPRGVSSKPYFNWSDNPNLVTDAVENGWSRFAFTNFSSSPSVSNKSILGYCGSTGDGKDGDNKPVETGWEVCDGSTEFVQKIRFNSGLMKVVPTTGLTMNAVSVIKSALPLPGPVLNTTPFPQEAYFEITILSTYEDEMTVLPLRVNSEGEKIKLIENNGNPGESLVHVKSDGGNVRGRSGGKEIVEGGKVEVNVVLCVGLGGGGPVPLKIPGSYPGSIGFNSDGSVYLEGVRLTNEVESDEWGKAEKVIGCGYNPSQKKVYFTVDSKLVREVYCTTEEFETPLYPILAANSNVTVLVNFGQSAFKYTQANLHRTPNPCFIGPSAGSPMIGSEDSRELFSMGRIDAHWLDRSTKRNAQYFGSVNRGTSDYDEFSEGDLFEIVLDSNSRGRSPSIHY
ncbi:putative SPRY domain, concanavalin A-like lectin/glucanase domain superfamily [Helianthus debilis subsp. tardiflorus]